MRVIMTGGGTGGHIYPAIAIADRIMERTIGSEILFVGTEKGLERELVPKFGYNIKFITVRGLDRKNILKNFTVLKEYRQAKKDAKKIIEEFEPDMVIGTGGYVCGPVIKAASDMGIKTFIHEQNAMPGLTNRILERYVDRLFLGFGEAGKIFKKPQKHIVSGNPVRDEFFKIKRGSAREILGLSDDKFMLLVFGGSRGAGRINKSMIDVIKYYSGNEKIEIFFATGKYYYEAIITELRELGIVISDNIHILEYIDKMENYLGAADLVVARSGALTVSEIAVCGVPSILIPSPNVTGDHQTFNAKVLSDKGASILLKEEDLSSKKLYDLIENIVRDEEMRKNMSIKAKMCAPLDASDIIYYNITV